MASNQPKQHGENTEGDSPVGSNLEDKGLKDRRRETNLHQKLLRLSSAIFLLALIAVIKLADIDITDKAQVRSLIASYGALAPIIYISLHAIAPVIFLPALPLTLLAGVLFGTWLGIAYAAIGLTIGAALSFLLSRYLLNDWLSNKIKNKHWEKINNRITSEGWKVVVICRIFLLLPSIILNYAFGLTAISFKQYIISTFFCMLVIATAFTPIASSIFDLWAGKITAELIAGVVVLTSIAAVIVVTRYKVSRKKLS